MSVYADESTSILALSTVLLEVRSMLEQNISDGVREALTECEEVLLDQIGRFADEAQDRMCNPTQET